MEFKNFKKGMQEHFNKMVEGATHLFQVEVDKDEMWNLYLDSFPVGTNEIFRERREYDCSCCRHFVKEMGRVVAIKNNQIHTIWDIDTDCSTFKPVSEALSAYIKSKVVSDVYISKESKIGTDKNFEQGVDRVYEWEHLYLELPSTLVSRKRGSIGELQWEYKAIRGVFKRSLEEITEDSVLTVLELIAQNSLYRGQEWKTALTQFLGYKKAYDKLSTNEKDLYTWEQSVKVGTVVGKIRNHSIGTLLVNISEGMDLDLAVRKYEAIVAPTNYKRPKAIFTQKMLDDAKATLTELGYIDSLGRRFATLEDISVKDILFSNKDSAKSLGGLDIFDEMSKGIAVNPKKFSKVEEITIEDFVNNILPIARELEVLLENKHKHNLVSLIAPQIADSKSMFKWDNNFGWGYSGNITDSDMKQNVKNAGGTVEGVLRFSIQWNDEQRETCDLDAHCIEANGNEIDFRSKGRSSSLSGMLDVDIINPVRDTPAVENIIYSDINKMKNGEYEFLIDIYSGRLKGTVKAEVEFDGEIYSFEASQKDFSGRKLHIATVTLKNGQFSIKASIDNSKTTTTREMWGLSTNQFTPVTIVMNSPNHWNEANGVGHKHYFFMLKDCINDESVNGFYNEFLKPELETHKRVFEALGSKMRVAESDKQLSGVGFSSTKRNDLIVKVKGSTERILKIKF